MMQFPAFLDLLRCREGQIEDLDAARN